MLGIAHANQRLQQSLFGRYVLVFFALKILKTETVEHCLIQLIVDGMECLLNYKAHNAGFCKVLTHPKWGSAVYPATIFAYAPRETVTKLVQEYQITL